MLKCQPQTHQCLEPWALPGDAHSARVATHQRRVRKRNRTMLTRDGFSRTTSLCFCQNEAEIQIWSHFIYISQWSFFLQQVIVITVHLHVIFIHFLNSTFTWTLVLVTKIDSQTWIYSLKVSLSWVFPDLTIHVVFYAVLSPSLY